MDNRNELNIVHSLFDEGKFCEAREILNGIKNNGSVEFFLVKGKIEEKFQNWGGAINAYNKVLEINNNSQEAKNHLSHIRDILNFFNTDLLNP